MILRKYKPIEFQRAYDTLFNAAFDSTSGLYLPKGGERRGGSHSVAFWDGFHNNKHLASCVPGTLSSVYYAAGKDFRKFLKEIEA